MLRPRPWTSAEFMLDGRYCDGSDAPPPKCIMRRREVLVCRRQKTCVHLQHDSDVAQLSTSGQDGYEARAPSRN